MSAFRRLGILVALTVLTLVGPFGTQADAQAIGAKTGVQWSQLRLDGDPYPGAVRRPGLFGGVYWKIGQGTIMGQVEGLAGRMTVRRNGLDTDIALFEVPVLVRVNLARAGNARVFVTGGGAMASRWRARNDVDGVKVDVTDEIEPFDLQWIVSGGVEVRGVLVDLRYTRGLRNIDATTDGNPKVTSERIALSVGYGF